MSMNTVLATSWSRVTWQCGEINQIGLQLVTGISLCPLSLSTRERPDASRSRVAVWGSVVCVIRYGTFDYKTTVLIGSDIPDHTQTHSDLYTSHTLQRDTGLHKKWSRDPGVRNMKGNKGNLKFFVLIQWTIREFVKRRGIRECHIADSEVDGGGHVHVQRCEWLLVMPRADYCHNYTESWNWQNLLLIAWCIPTVPFMYLLLYCWRKGC